MTGLTVEQLARSNPVRGFLAAVLADEAERGRIKQAPDGTWQAAPELVARFADAFSHLNPDHFNPPERRASNARTTTTR